MESINVIMPKGLENLQLPDPSLVNYYNDVNNRIYWINCEINSELIELIQLVSKWNIEDKDLDVDKRTPIKLFFFSPGGDLDVAYSLIDIIELSKTPIIGINAGQCASAAAYIYLACHKRVMLPHSYFIFHQGSGTLSGTFGEISAQMGDYQQQVEELGAFMIQHSNYSVEEVAEKIVGEWYVRKDEAIEKGVSHGVVKNLADLI